MIYFVIFAIYSLGIMAFVLVSYILWLNNEFQQSPVGFSVKFRHMGKMHYGVVVGRTRGELLVRCRKGVRYRYVATELCSPCLFKDFP